MHLRIIEGDKTTEIVSTIPYPNDNSLFKHTDAEGDRITVGPSFDPSQGPSVYLRTDKMGCSIPANRLEEFISACRRAVQIVEEEG